MPLTTFSTYSYSMRFEISCAFPEVSEKSLVLSVLGIFKYWCTNSSLSIIRVTSSGRVSLANARAWL